MPDRQIPWRKVASELGGEFYCSTNLRDSRYRLTAQLDDLQVLVQGRSTPYGMLGGNTKIHVRAPHALGARLYLVGNSGSAPLIRRFFFRDVRTGDGGFDARWIVNAKRQAQAQAFLGATERSLLDNIPAPAPSSLRPPSGLDPSYRYQVHHRSVEAHSLDFELSAERLLAAISACVGLSRAPRRLLSTWRALAVSLGSRLEYRGRWTCEGSTRIRFPLLGTPMIVTPLMVQTGWRQDRLRTRVFCECPHPVATFRVEAGATIPALGDTSEVVGRAIQDLNLELMESQGTRVLADMDGDITDPIRVAQVATVVAKVARANQAAQSPYR